LVCIASYFIVTSIIISGQKYHTAKTLMANGNYEEAIVKFEDLGEYKDSLDLYFSITNSIVSSAGGNHTVGLKKDGTVVATGYNYNGRCNISEWTNIVAVSAGGSHTVGLKKDGTTVAIGVNEYGQCNISEWTSIGR